MRKIKMCMLREGFTQKPSSDRQYKDWTDRLGNPVNEYMAQSMLMVRDESEVELDPVTFVQKLQQGCPWVASWFDKNEKGKRKRILGQWVSQQIIAADLDDGTIGPEEALDMALDNGLEPMVIHHTFSSTKEKPKLRVIFVLDELVEDIDLAKALWLRVGEIYKSDVNASDIVKIYQGGKPDCHTYFNPEAWSTIEEFGQLPEIIKSSGASIEYGSDYRVDGNQDELFNGASRWHQTVMKNIMADVRRVLRNPHAGTRIGNIKVTSRRQALFTVGRKFGQCPYFFLNYAEHYILKYISDKPVWLEYDRDIDQITMIIREGLAWGRDHMIDYEAKYKAFQERINANLRNSCG